MDTGKGKCVAVAMSQDGHCLFSSIAHQLKSTLEVGSQEFVGAAQNLRTDAVAFIKKNQQHFTNSIEAAVKDQTHTNRYLQKTKRGRSQAYLKESWKGY